MLLVADIGNTNIVLGLYNGDELVQTYRILSDKTLLVDDYKKKLFELFSDITVSDCVIGSVVIELSEVLKKACDECFGIESFLFTPLDKTGVVLDVDKPETVGADRVANAYCAFKKYSTPCIVVDLGSATTFDILSLEGKFYGGIIMPGINMQLNSLCEKTSKLPKIDVEEIEKVIGVDTKTCILSGVVRGHACAIEGLIAECEKEIGQRVTIVGTGGLSMLVSKYMSRGFDYLEPNLTLDGFRLLYELNKK